MLQSAELRMRGAIFPLHHTIHGLELITASFDDGTLACNLPGRYFPLKLQIKGETVSLRTRKSKTYYNMYQAETYF
jgi:hypothetical protein